MQVLVTGSVIYFNPSTDPALPVEKQRLPPMGPTELKKFKERADVERLPRAFHVSFVLVPDEGAEGVKVRRRWAYPGILPVDARSAGQQCSG
jgi:hypothetical protein